MKHLKGLPWLRWRLGYQAEFTQHQFAKLKQGFEPQDMDDKWLIRFERGHLDFHRSWTGFCIYRLVIAGSDDGCRVVGSWVNRNLWQYRGLTPQHRGLDLDEERRLVRDLIESKLLRPRNEASDG